MMMLLLLLNVCIKLQAGLARTIYLSQYIYTQQLYRSNRILGTDEFVFVCFGCVFFFSFPLSNLYFFEYLFFSRSSLACFVASLSRTRGVNAQCKKDVFFLKNRQLEHFFPVVFPYHSRASHCVCYRSLSSFRCCCFFFVLFSSLIFSNFSIKCT